MPQLFRLLALRLGLIDAPPCTASSLSSALETSLRAGAAPLIDSGRLNASKSRASSKSQIPGHTTAKICPPLSCAVAADPPHRKVQLLALLVPPPGAQPAVSPLSRPPKGESARRHSASYHPTGTTASRTCRYSPSSSRPVFVSSRGRRCLSEPSKSFRHRLRFRFRFRVIPSSPSPHSLSDLHIILLCSRFLLPSSSAARRFCLPASPSSFSF